MHHDPGYFNEPEKFIPERWIEEKNDTDGYKPFIPFGGGARICAGMQFSLMEQKIALSMLLRNFEFYLIPCEDGLPPPYKTGSIGLLRPEGLRVGIRSIIG
ncbi:Cytochrome P450 3A4 [Nowakowskiella sp. JEL0078]|nr:Cytochrome P450 3A4 [Nowakowskiella sp. JEL0078]